jgi:hypothetical protein
VLSTVKPLTLLFITVSKLVLHRPIPSNPSDPVTLLFHTAVPLVLYTPMVLCNLTVCIRRKPVERA